MNIAETTDEISGKMLDDAVRAKVKRLAVPICFMVECALEVLDVPGDCIKVTADLLPPDIGGMLDTISRAPHAVLVINVLSCRMPLHYVVAHEMVHYAQWREGRLAYASDVATRKTVMVWEGRIVEEWDQSDVTTMPWEQEAYLLMEDVGDAMVRVRDEKFREHANVA